MKCFSHGFSASFATALALLTTLGLSIGLSAQTLNLPPSGANNKCVATQYVGSLVHVTVTWNSPDVKSPSGDDRTGAIWGQLVPYGLTDLGFGLRNPLHGGPGPTRTRRSRSVMTCSSRASRSLPGPTDST